MNDLAQDRIKKPKSDDMSMDEILASIRKIISSDDDKRHVNKFSDDLYPHEKKNDADTINKTHNALSAREQLLSLTKPDLYNSDLNNEYQKTPRQFDGTQNTHYKSINNSNTQKPIYQKLTQNTDTKPDPSILDFDYVNSKNDPDEEILRALNNIRDSLSSVRNTPDKHIDSLNKNTLVNINNTNTENYQSSFQKQQTSKVTDTTVKNNLDNVNGIDLKPAQFTGDAVPEFLKKFKKQQQQSGRDKHDTNINNVNYDFSKVPNFDESAEVITLTEKIMPTTKDNLYHQEQAEQPELPKKNNFLKLRQSTEEIMKRVSERTIIDDNDFSQEDSPMASLIMRTLHPILKEWIDENMQLIAEQVLRDEFRRGLK